VVGKTARVVAKGSDKLARKLGEQNSMESRTDRIRRILQMQETIEHDQVRGYNPDGMTWRDRLNMIEEKTPEQKAKSDALAKSKELTKQGKHKEASEVFKKAFPNFGK
jgi:urocanate hydratase